MKKFRKLFVMLLSGVLVLSLSVPALAETTTPGTTDQSVKVHSFDPEKAKERLQNRIEKVKELDGLRDLVQPLRELQAKEKEDRAQIRELRDKIKGQMKAAAKARDTETLITALDLMIKVQDDIARLHEHAANVKSSWEQLKANRKDKDLNQVKADIEIIRGELNALIKVEEKVIGDLQNISSVLDKAAPASVSPQTSSQL